MTIIILEGPDGCGKTTLANDLVKTYNATYWHCGVVDNVYQLHNGIINKIMEGSPYDVHVIDRLYVSEYVYGNIFRDGESYDTSNFASKFKHVMIYCNIPFEAYLNHHKVNSDRELFKTNLDDIYHSYVRYFEHNPPDITYNYLVDKFDTSII